MAQYNCVICNEAVSLNESKADEKGQCVHGDCYAMKLIQPVQTVSLFTGNLLAETNRLTRAW